MHLNLGNNQKKLWLPDSKWDLLHWNPTLFQLQILTNCMAGQVKQHLVAELLLRAQLCGVTECTVHNGVS